MEFRGEIDTLIGRRSFSFLRRRCVVYAEVGTTVQYKPNVQPIPDYAPRAHCTLPPSQASPTRLIASGAPLEAASPIVPFYDNP